jgi:hypothetical protein
VIKNKNINFITYFTKEFLIQGTVAIESFIKFHQDSSGFIICLDKTSVGYLRRKKYGKKIKIYELKELPSIHKMFKKFLLTRTFAESIISIKPILINEFIKQIPAGDSIVYFDADMFFFDSLSRVKSVIKNSELVLSEHLFPKSMASSQIYGIYNGGFIIFKNSKKSIAVLQIWKKLCIEWCELRLYQNRFADQKYLEQFVFFDGVKVIRDPGINNGQYYFREHREIRFYKSKNLFFQDNFTLICFHFHGIAIHKNFISTGFNRYGLIRKPLTVLFRVYLPYMRSIKREIIYVKEASEIDLDDIVIPLKKTSNFRKFRQILNFTLAPYKLDI